MKQQGTTITVMATFIWIGFVCAISFMEAWLKFQAPGITIPLGLGIGRLVFGALNKMELLFSFLIAISLMAKPTKQRFYLFYIVALLIVLVQTFYMLPVLDARAELHIQGAKLPTSNLHFIYIGVEFVKILCLTIFGYKLLQQINLNEN